MERKFSNTNPSLSRREFLKIGSLATAGLIINQKEGSPFWPYEVVSKIETDKPEFALTIDDGWIPESLVTMLDILKEKRIKADFFLVGVAAIACERKYPGIIGRLADEGHRIAYHTFEHKMEEVKNASSSWFSRDYDAWIYLFRRLLGSEKFAKSFFYGARAPGGYFTNSFIDFCRNKHLIPYGWSITSKDLDRGTLITKGDILLLHVVNTDEEFLYKLTEFTDRQLTPTTISCLISSNSCTQVEEEEEEDGKDNLPNHQPRYCKSDII